MKKETHTHYHHCKDNKINHPYHFTFLKKETHVKFSILVLFKFWSDPITNVVNLLNLNSLLANHTKSYQIDSDNSIGSFKTEVKNLG